MSMWGVGCDSFLVFGFMPLSPESKHISVPLLSEDLGALPWSSGNKVIEANRGAIPRTGMNIGQYALARASAMYGGLV